MIYMNKISYSLLNSEFRITTCFREDAIRGPVANLLINSRAPYAGLTLGQRRRRWANINPALARHNMSALYTQGANLPRHVYDLQSRPNLCHTRGQQSDHLVFADYLINSREIFIKFCIFQSFANKYFVNFGKK